MRWLIALFLLSCINLYSQIPSGYYQSAENLKGDELKTALYNIIKNHKTYPYSSSSTDTWDILKESDRDPDNSSNVILFYTGWSVNAEQEYNSGNGWNREHVWAKSHGDFGTSQGPGTDAHHLRPCDISVNSARDSRWFDYCDEPYLDNGLATGCYRSSTEYTWQPRAEVMGDVARIIFYMATRYEGENGEPDLEVIDYFPADNYTNQPVHALLTSLLEWNELDPVDDFERNRNEVVYDYQGNRNPFIDHPEYVNLIYKDNTSTEIINKSDYSLYPNPVKNILYLPKEISGQKTIYDSQGRKVFVFDGNQADLSTLEKGVYFIILNENSPERNIFKILRN